MVLPQRDDFWELFVNDTPLLDVRAPIEFAKGSLPLAENRPLINDAERHEIGIRYAEMGQDRAVELGHELVQGETRDQRIAAWAAFARQHPEGVLYCWRGGMRSKIAQQWLHDESSILYPRIRGGYKALRHYLLEELERSAEAVHPFLVGGRTGVGKTRFLLTLDDAVDLEGLANHRGSAFGPRVAPQPTQVDFENALSIALIKHRAAGNRPLAVEDEGRNIGSLGIPEPFFNKMRSSPLLLLEVPLEERIAITHQEYIDDALAEHLAHYGEAEGFERWRDYLLGSLDKIRRRLGDQRQQELRKIMEDAFVQQLADGDSDGHRVWIERLLVDYYDPMYDYQLSNKGLSVAAQGDADTLREFLARQT